MANVAGMGTTFNLLNFVGELFKITPTDTPFLAIAGGLSGGRQTLSKQFPWQTVDNAAAEQPSAVEGAVPTYEERDRAEIWNTTQIFQYGWHLTYTKQAAIGNVANAEPLVGTQPVTDEYTFQLMLKLERAARDVDFSYLNGTFAYPADNATARKTRGIITAVNAAALTTVAAGTADLSKDHIDELVRKLVDNGAPLRQTVAFANSFNRQAFSNVYAYAPEDRNYGGVSIKTVETDFDVFGVTYERQVPAGTVLLADMSVVVPRFLLIPRKGHFFVEPQPSEGSSDKWMLYGESGIQYGPPHWHGTITGLSTS